jgi:hypothetical protein
VGGRREIKAAKRQPDDVTKMLARDGVPAAVVVVVPDIAFFFLSLSPSHLFAGFPCLKHVHALDCRYRHCVVTQTEGISVSRLVRRGWLAPISGCLFRRRRLSSSLISRQQR